MNDAKTYRVAIVDDSPTSRLFLREVLDSHPELSVVGEAVDGSKAVSLVKSLHPDIVCLDLVMPGRDGYSAAAEIMRESPRPVVIVSKTFTKDSVGTSLDAIRAGALATLAMPPGRDDPSFEAACRTFTRTVRALAEVRTMRKTGTHRRTSRPSSLFPRTGQRRLHATPEVLAIAASTGGPAVLHRLFSSLERSVAVPILVVQHIGGEFLDGLTSWLGSASSMPVKLAEAREPLRPGLVYLAPPDVHLGVAKDRTVQLRAGAKEDRFRPSADHLFASVAEVYGPAMVAAILTGMGDDGVLGLQVAAERRAYVIAQDQSSCAVFGMPKAAIEQGLVQETVPDTELAATLHQIFRAQKRS